MIFRFTASNSFRLVVYCAVKRNFLFVKDQDQAFANAIAATASIITGHRRAMQAS